MSRRGPRPRSTAFAWNMLRNDSKLMAYPVVRILAGVVLFAVMWPLIFDISAMEVGSDLASVGDALQDDADMNEGRAAGSSLMSHTDFGWLFAFLAINAFLGVVSLGALTGQALAIARGENRSVAFGYAQAMLRLPQLLAWWIVTIIVGFILSIIESHRVIGAIVAAILGVAWSILTFFSITAIMATGCGPVGAIGRSKSTVVDVFHKIGKPMSPGELRTVRRGIRVGGPLLAINMILSLTLIALLYLDMRWLHAGGHGVTAGGFGALLLIGIVNGAFSSALWSIVKAVGWVWAEEGRVPAGVDASELDDLFTTGSTVPA